MIADHDIVPIVVIVLDIDEQIAYMNRKGLLFADMQYEDVIGKHIKEVIHVDNEVYKAIRSAIDSGITTEAVVFCSDKSWFSLNAIPYVSESKRYVAVTITELKHMVNNENTYVNLYQLLAAKTDDLILFMDMDGKIIDANNAAVKEYGYTYEELCSINIKDLETDAETTVFTDEGETYYDTMHRRRDGSRFDVEVSTRNATIGDKRIYASIIRDVTERKAEQQKLKEQEELFRTIYEQASIGMAFCSIEGDIISINPMLEKILGRTNEEMIPLGWMPVIHPEDLPTEDNAFAKFRFNHIKHYTTLKRFLRSDGTIVWGRITLSHISFSSDAKQMILCMIEDITERVNAENALSLVVNELRKSEVEQKAMLANNSDVISIVTREGIVKYVSPNVEKIFFWTIDDVKNTSMWDRIHPEDVDRVSKKLNNLMKTDNSEEMIEVRYKCKNGEYRIVEIIAKNLLQDPDINGLLLNYRDITLRREKEDEVNYLYFHDVLTGIYNRRYFDHKLKALDNESHLPLSIIMTDINGLKLINNALGFEQGDRLIIDVSNVITRCIRTKDILARIGGDEFCILLPNTTSSQAKSLMKQILYTYDQYKQKVMSHTNISIGCATRTSMSEKLSDIMSTAEEKMYRDKLLQKKSLHSSIITSMKTTLFAKSQETEEHAERLITLSKAIGQKMKMTDEQLNELELLSSLHDIGKIGISDIILNKPDKLTEDEWSIMRKHSEIGFQIAVSVPELEPIAECILYHHERYDGNGYPSKLKGEEIPLLSRIIAVIDSYDAMTSDRPYRKAMTREAAIKELINNAGTQYDPNIVDLFISLIDNAV